MYQKSLYDITEVCKMLDTTSRTLRFYEEKGIIQSTTVGISSRRQYNEKQISRIKNVFVLRTLGLSVKAIAELQTKGIDLKDAVISKCAEIYASIESRIREINLLNEALEVELQTFVESVLCGLCYFEVAALQVVVEALIGDFVPLDCRRLIVGDDIAVGSADFLEGIAVADQHIIKYSDTAGIGDGVLIHR